jgi:hypothetical protein
MKSSVRTLVQLLRFRRSPLVRSASKFCFGTVMPPRRPPLQHAWEVSEHVWEAPGDAPEGWADGDDTDFEEEQISAPEREFVEHMLGLYNRRKLTAKDFCIAMHFAGLSGIAAAQKFGKKPDCPSGHYQRHLDPLLVIFTMLKFQLTTGSSLDACELSRCSYRTSLLQLSPKEIRVCQFC